MRRKSFVPNLVRCTMVEYADMGHGSPELQTAGSRLQACPLLPSSTAVHARCVIVYLRSEMHVEAFKAQVPCLLLLSRLLCTHTTHTPACGWIPGPLAWLILSIDGRYGSVPIFRGPLSSDL